MTRERLRPLPPADELAVMYATPHNHRIYGRGHIERVDGTIDLAGRHLDRIDSIGDLSCGNGEIVRRVAPTAVKHLGDIAPGVMMTPGEFGYLGPIEETIHLMPQVSAFVCSETIEHLDDPGLVLATVRTKAQQLVLSTPLDCWDDTNGEHLWAWDQDGVEDLLGRCGWALDAFTTVDTRVYGEPYLFGIWVCS